MIYPSLFDVTKSIAYLTGDFGLKIIAGETFIELQPETAFEVEQLKRLDKPQERFTTVLIPASTSSYPESLTLGGRLRINFPIHDWGL